MNYAAIDKHPPSEGTMFSARKTTPNKTEQNQHHRNEIDGIFDIFGEILGYFQRFSWIEGHFERQLTFVRTYNGKARVPQGVCPSVTDRVILACVTKVSQPRSQGPLCSLREKAETVAIKIEAHKKENQG